MANVVSQTKVNKMAKKQETPVPTPSVSKKTKVTTPPVEVVVPLVQETQVVADTRSADVILASLQESLKTLSSEVSTRLRAAVHEAQEAVRSVKRELRDSKRRRKVDPATLSPEDRAAWEARRNNNAFLKPRLLTDELCTFMGLPSKSMRSQTDVTKYVSKYVREHNCFDPKFKRRILPDSKLAKLLRVTDKNEVSYLNLQSFLKVHYVKA